ncbi:hypothetical protein GCM10011390_20030 [Aureimonas endophytica]|uniref:Glycosyl transferase family 1 domain-containing protein n=1 Tax=Aureimonas endophytica TaxID=2027858 RepID=A0A916ZJM5_9HYPH|nr:glycosyltransferase family 4 protein [Aureimonas endophytica]GGE01166.1 hypothetical protein GCM10011390_20030 [Aureimonas endophytica]
MSDEPAEGVILFAQVNRFSNTNDALEAALKRHLPGTELRIYRAYPAIRKNPVLLTACLLAVLWSYGPKAAFDPKSINQRLIKTPFFFWLASRLVRRQARATPGLRAVLQTQGLFNGKTDRLPLFIYTDNTLLNRINGVVTKSPILAQEKVLYRDADYIGVSASHVVTSLIEDYGVAPTVPENVLIGANSPVPKDAGEARYRSGRILFVGIDWERKGGPELVAAFRRVVRKFPEARLTIAGSKPEIADLPQATALGKIPPEKVGELMREACLYCMPSHIEPSSVAVVEAASSGLPIVATAVGGFLDSVKDGETGLLVPPGDVEALADALERLLADPELCARYGRAGQALMKQFRWDTVSAKLAAGMTARL